MKNLSICYSVILYRASPSDKAKPTVRWGQKATGPRESGDSRVAWRGNPAFFFSWVNHGLKAVNDDSFITPVFPKERKLEEVTDHCE